MYVQILCRRYAMKRKDSSKLDQMRIALIICFGPKSHMCEQLVSHHCFGAGGWILFPLDRARLAVSPCLQSFVHLILYQRANMTYITIQKRKKNPFFPKCQTIIVISKDGFTADLLRTNKDVTNNGFVPLSVTASQVNE